MAHTYDLNFYTYFDVKILPEAVDQILESTRTAAASGNGSLVDVEYLGHVGELDNHLLYRVPKQTHTQTQTQIQTQTQTQTDSGTTNSPLHRIRGEELEEQRNKHIVDAISAVQGVVHVDVQTLRHRAKRDEL
ncbi:hypothetical protein BC939DRAFT_472487 [Gamsiella multidivaricata]|uniref:uncharacterized protein n=1 Tax=Gamsiella multidivaricata TaxID=101098 RepID=UPI002220447E|nr:uncharacterized protein BC939DRAFT_472487 [Gamsiella multidivaricata]KAI7832237.1 hypothetical protein BC939DRAFT_472487 [Gamsiella multidivaricata]